MGETNHTCVFCQSLAVGDTKPNDIIDINCPNCGKYLITAEANEDFPQNKVVSDNKYLISGYLREMTELRLRSEVITNDNISTILDSAMMPRTVADKFYKMLLYLYRNTTFFGEEFGISLNCPAVAYGLNAEEINSILTALSQYGYIAYTPFIGGVANVSLTLEGSNKALEILTDLTVSDIGFVAMWFNDEMMSIYDDYILKAIIDSGYRPLIISRKEHNDDINDQIVAEIRKSRFLIADFTGHRGGVYYEAGFAYGLGKEVIHTCRRDWFEKGIHFDLEHRNFIVWESGEELYMKLKNRIGATIVK